MAGTRSRSVTGVIAVVQEERFRLVTDSGQAYLLTLHNNLRTSAEDLCRWHKQGTRVIVEYEGEPNLTSGVACAIRPRPAEPNSTYNK